MGPLKAITIIRLWLGTNDPRIARLKLAVASWSLAKVVRLLAQTTIIGLSVRHLGVEYYGLWLTVVAALGWLSWGQAGLAPGLVNALATAEGDGRFAEQGVYFTTAMAVVTALVVAVFLTGSALLSISAPAAARLLGVSATETANFDGAWASFLQIGLVLALVRFPLALVESAYVGLQSIHVLRMWEIGGQVLCVAAVAAMVHAETSSALFLLGAGIAAECGTVGAGCYLVLRLKPHLRPSLSKLDLRACRGLLDLSVAYILLQVTGYLVMHAGTLILAAYHGPRAVPVFALTMQLYQMASGVWMMFVSALWGAFAEAQARGEWRWIERVQRQIVFGSMALSVTFSVVLVFGGNWILRSWSGGRVGADGIFLVAMAAMCVVFSWAVLHAHMMSALSLVWEQGWAATANGALIVVLGLVLIPRLAATGLALTLLLACALSTAWAYPMLLRRTMRIGANVPA
jgi:O-antigen/teichoic acid export membrane protein